MAKREKKQTPVPMTRKYRSRVEEEERQLRLIRIGAAVVLGIVILVLLAGLFKTQVADPAATRSAEKALESTPAVTVNGTVISIADWQSRVRFERQLRINQIAQLNQQMNLFDASTELGQQFRDQSQAQIQEITNLLDAGDGIAADVLDQMVEEELIRQEADRRGIVVTPEELQSYIEVNLFSYPYPPTPEPVPTLPPPTVSPTETVTPVPTPTPTTPPTPRSREDFEADYNTYIDQVAAVTGMSEDQFRSLITGEIYATKLFQAYRQEVEPDDQQVKGRYIYTDDTATAESLAARLLAGETFEELAAEVEADDAEEPAARVASFDWSPVESLTQRFGADYAAAVLDTAPGETVTDTFVSPTGQVYLIYVEGNEIRELPDYLIEQRQVELIQAWLDEQKLGEGIVYGDWRPYIPREPSLP
jgi:hypothetical protein